MSTTSEPRLSVNQLAEVWGCSRQHVYTLVASGRIRHIRIGDMIRFRPEDILAFEAAASPDPHPASPPQLIRLPSQAAFSPPNGGANAGYHAALRMKQKRAVS